MQLPTAGHADSDAGHDADGFADSASGYLQRGGRHHGQWQQHGHPLLHGDDHHLLQRRERPVRRTGLQVGQRRRGPVRAQPQLQHDDANADAVRVWNPHTYSDAHKHADTDTNPNRDADTDAHGHPKHLRRRAHLLRRHKHADTDTNGYARGAEDAGQERDLAGGGRQQR